MESSSAKSTHNAAAADDREDRLLARIAELEREVARLRPSSAHAAEGAPIDARRPSRGFLIGLGLVLLAAVAAAFYMGYQPRQRLLSEVLRDQKIEDESALPVRTAKVRHGLAETKLRLPGTVQAINETPVLARADGYVKRRNADIGDRVAAGRVLAEIEAPELDDQSRQSAAALEQSRASLEQARANLKQGQANAELARVTAARWSHLRERGVVSRQENDQQQAVFQAQTAAVAALGKAVEAAKSNVAAAEASFARFEKMRGYLQVRAPFPGVVTQRNIEVGTLVTAGNTLLYRLAETGTMRTFLNVPQVNAVSIKPGLEALLTLPERPGVVYHGRVARASGALDPATRTMLVEIHVANRDGSLLPGMYVDVILDAARSEPPQLVNADAIDTRSDGAYVFVIGRDRVVHSRKVQIGRDFGQEIELLGGAGDGDLVVVNPNDAVRDGVRVRPVSAKESK
jgi:RND family efflux transporter MFP subunit